MMGMALVLADTVLRFWTVFATSTTPERQKREGEQEMRSLSRSTLLLICYCLVRIECQKSVMQGLPASRLGVPPDKATCRR